MSRSFRAGLVLLGLLSVIDLAGPFTTDGDHPPMWIALIGAALGVASMVCVVLAWRGAAGAVLPLAVLRIMSALTAVPAFFAGGVPAAIIGFAAVLVLVTLVGVALVVGARKNVVAPA